MQKSVGRPLKSGEFQNRRVEGSPSGRAVTRVISFTSGKGGVGKTSTVVNTAIALARMGRSVAVLDADLGLANINVLLGLRPACTIEDVLEGGRLLEEAVLDGPEGISVIPAASGASSICTLKSSQRLSLMQAVENFAFSFDYLLIDTQAGIGSEVMYFNSASGEIVCVINDEPTSLTDAYALIKVLCRQYGEKSISILVNNVAGEAAGQGAYRRRRGRRPIADKGIGHAQHAFAIVRLRAGRDQMPIAQQVVHRRKPGGPGPGDLDRGRLAREDQQPVLRGMAGQLEEDVHAVGADLLGADVGVTGATALVLETATALIAADDAYGQLVSNLPFTHVVVAYAHTLVETLDEGLGRVRYFADGVLGRSVPRYVGSISGASRTGDNEMVIVQGMHGPGCLHLLLLDMIVPGWEALPPEAFTA